ncbi:hypothetical protein AB0K09_07310 [Streptomyces sp. NPDC049577]|uniref:hypothetical protein n=1 Tax=Streptomyces sp. NPDC049577 TaxID=3155153 RepID=UPI0034193AD1
MTGPTGAALARTTVTRAEQRAFTAQGYVGLPGLWDERLADALAAEARARRPHAKVPARGPRTPLADGRRPGPGIPAAGGPLLARVHLALVGAARELTGRLLVPTFAAYGYYEGDDRVLLHVDTEQCDLTLLTAAYGAVTPLHLHPDLVGSTMERLGRLEDDPSWDRAGGIPVSYPRTGVTALNGHVVPHHRPRDPAPGSSAVAALCYRALF